MTKMIVIDLDGTLLNANERVSEESKNYLMNLKKNGYIIAIATGRIYSSALKTTDGANFANYVITDSGSCTYDLVNNKPLFLNLISPDIAKGIMTTFNSISYEYIDVCNKDHYYKYSDIVYNEGDVISSNHIDDILDKCQNISHMSISISGNEKLQGISKKLNRDFDNLTLIIMQDSFSNKKWIEILPLGCSKYKAISKLASHLNIDNQEIMCFGDGLNDVEMIEKCGWGVALKNALPEVKKVAKATTKFDNNENGIIKYLSSKLI